jgi:hypothetical protein
MAGGCIFFLERSINAGGFVTADDRWSDGFDVEKAPEDGGKSLCSANNSKNVNVFTMREFYGEAGNQLISLS